MPATVVRMETRPLTPNGKVDRKALPLTHVVAPRQTEFTAPQGALEQTIAAIWQDALGAPRVGLDDNFFDLGGHSLLTVHVLAQLRERLGRSVPITDLFQYTTVRSLANHLGGNGNAPTVVANGPGTRCRASGRLAPPSAPERVSR